MVPPTLETRRARRLLLASSLLLLACESPAVPEDARAADDVLGEDAAVVDALRPDAGTDAFTRTTPPTCEPPRRRVVPACGTGTGPIGLVASEPLLDDAARLYDRGHVAIHAWGVGVSTEVRANDESARMRIDRFLRDGDGFVFEAFDGAPIESLVSFQKVAGSYAGAGAAADAFRYGTLRDEGADCDELAAARAQLHAAMDAMHRAVAITGVRGVIARGYQRRDRPGFTQTTTPLFDAMGHPLPAEKTNGTWRDDQSGLYPEYAWEDSVSRDMLIGWVLGMAAAWEVSEGDDTIDATRLATLRDDASAIAHMLAIVSPEGHDLEIHDADGRITYNGYLHESAIDRVYVPRFHENGQHAIMALGIVAALSRISGDAEIADWLHNDLVRARDLPGIAGDDVGFVDTGVSSNYSNYNMAFTGGWLATRYLCDDDARERVRGGVIGALYGAPGEAWQPAGQGQSFYDLVAIAARARGDVLHDLEAAEVDAAGLDRALASLRGFPAPYWAEGHVNCDAAELASRTCIGLDGTTLPLSMDLGRGDIAVSTVAVPFAIRPPSNFHWRSNPYAVNGEGDPLALYPAVDFRLAYWMARYLRVAPA
ncbi:MAG: hypothetical protein U0353_33420 [Sandaracinus sp.]